jgi:hypothetical protein
MNDYFEESGEAVLENIKHYVVEYFRHLQKSFEAYFPRNNNDKNWLKNPLIFSFQIENFSIKKYEQLIDIVIWF